MRRTSLRSKEMHTKYVTYRKDPLFMETAPSIADYKHWRIIANQFPYDTIAKVHHMLIPRRKFANRGDMTKGERTELDLIIDSYLSDYDQITINLPHQRSVPHWYHLHLITLK